MRRDFEKRMEKYWHLGFGTHWAIEMRFQKHSETLMLIEKRMAIGKRSGFENLMAIVTHSRLMMDSYYLRR